jgi:hypothetical protein
MKLGLGFLKTRDAIRTRHGTLNGERPEPAQVLRAAAGFVNAADVPAAAVDGVVLAFFVDAGAEAAGAELESLGISIRPL